MSFVIANPEMLAAAATDLAGIRSAISAATAAAAAPTIQVAAAGADEVSLASRRCLASTPRPIRRSAPRRRSFTTSSCRP